MANKKYLWVLVLLLLLTVVGYGTFYVFAVEKALPKLYGLYAFAVIAGVATFFNPCSFGLLPGYLSYFFTLRVGARRRPPAGTMFGYGLISASGIVTFATILGVAIGIFGTGLGQALGFAGALGFVPQIVRISLGAVLILLGLAAWLHIALPFMSRFVKAAPAKAAKRSLWTLYMYGFTYNMIGIACAGPILAGLIALALASSFAAAIAAFIIYAITMATLMIIISLLVALAGKETMLRVTTSGPKILKLSAIILVIVGTYVLISGIFPAFFARLFIPG